MKTIELHRAIDNPLLWLRPFVLCCVVVTGCGHHLEEGEPQIARKKSPIVNGTATTGTHPAVVHVSAGGGCSGSFIHPNWVLTAGHCIAPDCPNPMPPNQGTCWGTYARPSVSGPTAGTIRLGDGPMPANATDTFTVDHVYFPGPTPADYYYDVALLHVTTPYTGPLLSLMDAQEQLSPDNVEDSAGDTVTIVGFSDNSGADDGAKRHATAEIVGKAWDQERSMILKGTTTDCHRTDHGDSGGPALLADAAGALRIAGVCSSLGKATNCYSYHSYVPHAFVSGILIGQPLDNHGDTCATATAISASANLTAKINAAGDKDVFKVTVPFAGKLTVMTTSSYNTDTFGTLRNSGCAQLVNNDDGGTGRNFLIEHSVAAGSYYVDVRHFSPSGVGPYSLTLMLMPGADDHGNVGPKATKLSIPSTTAAGIDYSTDVDMFRIDVPAGGGQLVVHTEGSLDTMGTLYGPPSQKIIAEDDDGGAGLNFRILRGVTAGTHHVAVRSYGNKTGNYTLRVNLSQNDDHGGTCAKATYLGSSGSAAGAIEKGGDVDFFRILVPSTRYVRVETNGSTDTYGTLYNSSCSPIVSDDDSANGTNFRISRTLAAGSYYVRVRHFSSTTGTGTYNLVLNPIY